jgi:hypothetical protein
MEIAKNVLDSELDSHLDFATLDRLFDECDVRMIDFKVNRYEIICLTNQDNYKTVYVFNLKSESVSQKINFRNKQRKGKNDRSFGALRLALGGLVFELSSAAGGWLDEGVRKRSRNPVCEYILEEGRQ